MERKTVKEVLFSADQEDVAFEDVPDGVRDFTDWLHGVVLSAPPEWRDQVQVRLTAMSYSDCEAVAGIEVFYCRPETDVEMKVRVERDTHYEQMREERDRREYERLKAKFG